MPNYQRNYCPPNGATLVEHNNMQIGLEVGVVAGGRQFFSVAAIRKVVRS